MDKVFIKQLEIDAIIGIYDFERTQKQTVVFDIEMAWDIEAAANSDNIDKALNYKTLSDELKSVVGASEFQLIETLAEEVSKLILNDYGVEWLRLKLFKPNALDGDTNVGVEITRARKNAQHRPGFLA